MTAGEDREKRSNRNRCAETKSAYDSAGQGHVFRFWETLDGDARASLLDQLEAVDLSVLDRLETALARDDGVPPDAAIGELPIARLPEKGGDPAAWNEAEQIAEAALRRGRVGAFLAAGGQGSRLGFDGPKGTFPIGPVTERSLFQLFCEGILASSRKWGSPIPLLVMTSRGNHEDTVRFFADHEFFGLPAEDVRFIPQGTLPAFTAGGKLLLESESNLFMSPDGHGGALKVLAGGGGLEWFRGKGVDTLYYFQVDNPLLPVVDPVFIGHHLRSGSQFTTKVTCKTGPAERMGVFARVDGVLRVVEYMHLSCEMAHRRDAEGRLVFWAGNVAVHVLDLSFAEELGPRPPLPLHVARKPESGIDEMGLPLDTEEAKALKLETFIFDAIPLAKNPLLVEVSREDEFAPIKSSTGQDTPGRARRMMSARAARWLESAGASVPRDAAGAPLHPIEISPLTALTPDDLAPLVNKGLDIRGPVVL